MTSLMPLLNSLVEDCIQPRVLMKSPFDPWLHSLCQAPPSLLRSWKPSQGKEEIDISASTFKVNLDVQQFRPEELKVKIVEGFAVVEGKHEDREDDHGFISREFTRRYKIPEGVDVDSLSSKLSSDGVLTLEAPCKVVDQGKKEIKVAIRRDPSLSPGVKQVDKKQKLEEMEEQ